MKKIFALFSVIALITIVSCKDEKSIEDTMVSDPSGTTTTTLNGSGSTIIYEGTASDKNYDVYHTYNYVQIRFGFDYSTLNTVIDAVPGISADTYIADYIRDGAEIVDIGNVKGLGYVTQKPSSGYTAQATIFTGHGYVIRFKHAFHLASAGDYYYSRFYVVSFLTSAITGGVNGAIIHMQGPF